MMKSYRSLLAVALVALVATALNSPLPTHAASHTWSGAVNGYWSNAGNWSSGGVPTLAETNFLSFPASAARTTVTNDIGALKVAAFSFSGSNYVIRGASTITVEPNLLNFNCQGRSNTIESALSFVSIAAVNVGVGDSLILSGMLSGTNGLMKLSPGKLYFKGAASNPLSGDLTVNSGELHFLKTGGATPYSGNRIVIGSANEADFTQLHLYADDQISDGADLEIQPSGKLFMNNFSDNVNSVTMDAGGLDTGTGTLGIYSSLNLTPSFDGFTWTSPAVLGRLEFHGTACTLSVSTNVCDIDADIVENGTPTAINKTGPGTVRLRGGGNFTGQFNVLQGSVYASTVNSLGAISGSTTVSNGASLIYGAGVTTSESLVLSGAGDQGLGALQLAVAATTTTFGNITLSNLVRVAVTNGGLLVLNGVVSGPGGLEKIGEGELSLTGIYSNTFAGASFVSKGKLTLNKNANLRAIASVTVTNGASLVFNNDEQMDNAGVLSIYSGAAVNMTNRNETIAGLNLGGGQTLDTGMGTLTLLGNVWAGTPYSSNSAPYYAVIRGNLSLGGATRIFDGSSYGLVLDCHISDGAGVGGVQIGNPAIGTAPYLTLARSNSFTGPMILGGVCTVSNSFAFGAPGGGVFDSGFGAWVYFRGPTASISGETLTITNGLTMDGINTFDWNGPIAISNAATLTVFAAPTAQMSINGHISGSGGLTRLGSGTLRLTQSNSYAGPTEVADWFGSGGVLVIQHPQALGGTSQGISIYEGGTLRLELPNGASVVGEALTLLGDPFTLNTNASLVLSGLVSNTWNGPVSIAGDPSRVEVQNGGTLILATAIGGTGALEKTGSGTLILAGTNPNTFTGETRSLNGNLFLNKPNGVQAVSNLYAAFSVVIWQGSEQIADAASVKLEWFGHLNLQTNTETFTHLRFVDSYVNSFDGTLRLLGDIDVSPSYQPWDPNFYLGIEPRLVLSEGTHRIFNTNTDPLYNPGRVKLWGVVQDLTTNAGFALSNVAVLVDNSNTFSGPVNLEASTLTIWNRHALGNPLRGVTMDQASALYLDLPNGHVVEGEALTTYFDLNQFGDAARFGSQTGFYATNGWSGWIGLGTDLWLVGPATWGLELSGPITGIGNLASYMADTLFLTGTATNTFFILELRSGKARLAKSPGVRAVGQVVYASTYLNSTPEIHIDAPDQLAPDVQVSLDGASFYLHDNPTQIRVLLAGGLDYNYIYCGTNPASALTISNAAFDSASEFFGDFNGTLLKQGAGAASFSGNFQNGDLFVQGGTFSRTSLGVVGQTVISPGAVVNSSGPNIFNFGALNGGGTLNIAGNNTWVGGSSGGTTFTGSIIGAAPGALLTKLGSGALTLAGPVTGLTNTLVQNGTLIVNTLMTNPVVVTPLAPGNFPTLGGTGTVGNVTLTGIGARLAPGATTNVPSYGKLTVASLTAGPNASYNCEIGGTNAGANLDQIEAAGTVTLSGGFANFSAFGAGATSNRYAVVKSAVPVSGTFAGDPEGDNIYPAAGRWMVITYLTAGGKEITLIEQAGAPVGNFGVASIMSLTNGHISLVGTGAPSVAYFILANTNLNTTNWINIGSTTGDWNGGINFTDTNAASFPTRFYRFQLQ